MITRRRLLMGGLAVGAAFAVAAVTNRFAVLGDEDREIVAAIAPVMLEGALPNDAAVMQVVRGTDVAIAGLPLAVRAEIRQLFGILRFPPTRMLLAGVWHSWRRASRPEIAGFLQSWRYSRFVQLRSGYDALHQLVLAAWYGSDDAWPAIGYPGPPSVPS